MLDNKIVSTYKNILDSSKSALTYMVVFSAFTMLFGYIYLYTFLWESNYLWIINNVEYKTIAVWGLPISLIFFGGSSLGLTFYKQHSSEDRRIIFALFIVTVSFFLLLLIRFFAPHLFYSMFTAVIGLAGLLSALSANRLTKIAIQRESLTLRYEALAIKRKELKEQLRDMIIEGNHSKKAIAMLKKVEADEVEAKADADVLQKQDEAEEETEGENIVLNKGLLFFISIILLASLIWAGLSGKWQADTIKDDNYLLIANVDNNQFGVLINNGSTFILVDLNNTDRLKIVSSTKIGYLTKNKKK